MGLALALSFYSIGLFVYPGTNVSHCLNYYNFIVKSCSLIENDPIQLVVLQNRLGYSTDMVESACQVP